MPFMASKRLMLQLMQDAFVLKLFLHRCICCIARKTFENGQDVFFLIRDYGPGIPEDELPLVKKKFYKGSSDTRGTGIGLAVCDEIVQMHNGTLTLENAEGGGTLVTVTLPAS